MLNGPKKNVREWEVPLSTWGVPFGTLKVPNSTWPHHDAYAMVGQLLRFSNACFTFSCFLKNIFFIYDHETLSYSVTNSLKPISNLIKSWCSLYKWVLLQQISKSSMASNQKFSQSTIHDINRWVRSFDFNTRTKFTNYKLEGIKALRNVKIKWDFLRATMKF